MNTFLSELKQRGLIAQLTNENAINEQLDKGVKLYCGFDPTADSLHVGSLLPLVTLLRFKRTGHTILPLIGGATGMIGDPSFKAQERTLNDVKTVNHFKDGITQQIKSLLGKDTEVVDNLHWTQDMSVLDFLRDIGKHFSINSMISKESVKSRIERPEQGISFTEFAYPLLQSMDFWKLMKSHECTMQLGGSDQWGNITAGIDLIHKKEGPDCVATGVTIPLVTKSDGTKFGKTESGAVWLSAEKTSPFKFFQFWLGTPDSDIEKLFKLFSFRTVNEIDEILAADKKRNKPEAQMLLAEELTALVHGVEQLNSVKQLNNALFTGNFENLSIEQFKEIEEKMPSIETEEVSIVELLVISGLAKSKKMARDFIQGGGVYLNGDKIIASGFEEIQQVKIAKENLLHNRFSILQRGRQNFVLLKF